MLHATIDLIRVNERMSEDRNRNTDKDGEKTNEREIQTRLIYKGEKKEKEGIKSLKMGAMLCKTLNNPIVIQPG